MATTVTGPILHVALDAHCELTNVSGQGAPSKFDKFGLALSSGALCLAAGAGEKVQPCGTGLSVYSEPDN